MKRTLRTCSAALFLTLPAGITSCSKKEEASPGAKSASSGSSSGAASTETTSADSAWGFASRLPAGTEAFAAFYRTADLVDAVKSSGFLKKLQSLPGAEQLGSMASDPDAEEAMALAREILGQEVVFVLPEGFTVKAAKILGAVQPFFAQSFLSGMQAGMKRMAEGGSAGAPPSMEALIGGLKPGVLDRMVNDLAEMEVPPLLMAVKAGGARAKLDGFVKQALEAMPPDAKAIIESGTFEVNGSGFQSLKITLSKAVPPSAVEEMKTTFRQITGDAGKAEALTTKTLSKTIEASWGWVGDHLVLALGRDHSHVKFGGLRTVCSVCLKFPVASPAGSRSVRSI